MVPPAPSATLRLFLIQITIGCVARNSVTASIQSRGILIRSTKATEDSEGDRLHSVFIFYKDIHINFWLPFTKSFILCDFFHSNFTCSKVNIHWAPVIPIFPFTILITFPISLFSVCTSSVQTISNNSLFHSYIVKIHGHGVYACHLWYIFSVDSFQSMSPSSFSIFLQYVAWVESCGRGVIPPISSSRSVWMSIVPEISANFSNRNPVVSVGSIVIVWTFSISHSSIPSLISIIVTHVSFSPERRAACIGEAPR